MLNYVNRHTNRHDCGRGESTVTRVAKTGGEDIASDSIRPRLGAYVDLHPVPRPRAGVAADWSVHH